MTRHTNPTRVQWRVAVLAGVALIATSLTGCTAAVAPGGAATLPSAVIGLTYIPNIQFAPFYVADHNGFDTTTASISLRHHGASEGLFTALAAGDEQFVVAGGDEILQARAQGIDIVAVASYYSQYPARIIVPQGSPIRSVSDLRGHSIGIPGKFGESWFALLVALKQAGLTESDVTITEIGYTQQAALTTGKVDAEVGFSNSDVISFQQAGFPVTVIDPGLPLVSICLGVAGSYATAHPDVVRTVIAGMKQGMDTALNDQATTLSIAAAYIPSFYGDTLATAKQVLPATTALFVDANGQLSPPFDPAQWDQMAQIMAAVGLIPQGTDAGAAFTNEFNGT